MSEPKARTLDEVNREYTNLAGLLGDILYRREHQVPKLKARMSELVAEGEALKAPAVDQNPAMTEGSAP